MRVLVELRFAEVVLLPCRSPSGLPIIVVVGAQLLSPCLCTLWPCA